MASDAEDVYPRPVSGEPVTRPPSGLLPARSPIEGRHVRIEPLDPEIDASDLYPASHGSEAALRIWDYLPWGPWQDTGAFETWLGEQAGSCDHIWYAFRPERGGPAKGMACYLDIAPAQGVIEIGGIWFSPDMQRTRAATEALFLMMAYAMDDLRYRRLQWRCNALNERSRSAARRLGFRFEGIFYNHMIVKGMNRDTAWYSITDREWPQVRDVIRDWLGEENFDRDGIATRSLSRLMRDRHA